MRGLIAQTSNDHKLDEHLSSGSKSFYCGFDPTADSLHIGSLVPLVTMRRLQQAGHRPIVLVGGATGLIGDPSFKAEERKLNTPDVVAKWVDKIRRQTEIVVDFNADKNAAIAVNNLDWTSGMSTIDFLRSVGKHFSINNMINKESVKQRIDREGEGISFTEFSYMLLQSMDFSELNRQYECSLQIGGSDQWGNITGGIDLCRRQNAAQVFGLTLPLVTKADGTKFGKTESGTIWLDAKKTSPYSFYQFWLATADADVYKFLRYFTFLDCATISQLEEEDKARSGRPLGQSRLAEEVTKLIHGKAALLSAQRITNSLFTGEINDLTDDDVQQLAHDGLPVFEVPSELSADLSITRLLSVAELGSGKQVKDAIVRGALSLNGSALAVEPSSSAASALDGVERIAGHYILVKMGKKKHLLLKV